MFAKKNVTVDMTGVGNSARAPSSRAFGASTWTAYRCRRTVDMAELPSGETCTDIGFFYSIQLDHVYIHVWFGATSRPRPVIYS